MIQAVGISINRWEPWNGVAAVRSGLIDAVQVIYNIFDQNPEDELLPACQEKDVAVIARVPFDEGSLTGKLTLDSRWPEGDWRNSYFVPENLKSSVEHAEALRPLIPAGMSMPEMALRFILNEPTVSIIIPGMRKESHVRANIACSDAGPLPEALHSQLRSHRWDRQPTLDHRHHHLRLVYWQLQGEPLPALQKLDLAAIVQELATLGEIGFSDEVRVVLRDLAERDWDDPGELMEVAAGIAQIGHAPDAIRVGLAAARRGALDDQRILRAVFPWPDRSLVEAEARAMGLDPYLLPAVARQESWFSPTARSRAGAVGYMQLMPGTAREVARRLGVPWTDGLLTVIINRLIIIFRL